MSLEFVIYELTLKCNLNCIHCGSSAGLTRPNELTTTESLKLVDDLKELGAKRLILSGGGAITKERLV